MVGWTDFLFLAKGEHVVEDWRVGFSSNPDNKFVLTNERLIFLKGKRGILRTRSYEVKEEFPLESIKDITEERKFLSSKTVIHTNKDKHTFAKVLYASGQPKNKSGIEYLREKVLQQTEKRRQELERKQFHT